MWTDGSGKKIWNREEFRPKDEVEHVQDNNQEYRKAGSKSRKGQQHMRKHRGTSDSVLTSLPPLD